MMNRMATVASSRPTLSKDTASASPMRTPVASRKPAQFGDVAVVGPWVSVERGTPGVAFPPR